MAEQTFLPPSEQGVHYYLIPVGCRVADKSGLSSHPILSLQPQDPQDQVRHILSVGAAVTGQGYLVCNVLLKAQWYIASLEWSLEHQVVQQFHFESVESPSRYIRTVVSFDARAAEDLHDMLGSEYDTLVMTFGSDATIHFSPGYHANEIELFLQHCQSSAWKGETWLRGAPNEWTSDDALYSAFHHQARSHPNHTALVSTQLTWTYAELLIRVEAFMSHLACHCHSDQPIALYLERDVHQIVATLACHGLGYPVVPIYYDTPLERVETQLAIVQCQCVITRSEKARVLSCDAELIVIDSLLKAQTPSVKLTATPITLSKPNYVYFTSGSEGVPKAVALPGRAIARIVDQPNFLGPMSEQVFSYIANPAFDASALELWGALYNGATLAILDKDEVLDVHVLSNTLRAFGVTTSFFTSGLFNRIADAPVSVFGTLSYVMFGGEKVSMPHVQRALEQAPTTQFIHCYGPTENGIFTTTYVVEPAIAHQSRDLPIGKPVKGTQITLLDHAQQPVPQGKVGQLVCFGDGLATEYVGAKAQTEQKFIEFNGERGYLTGDYARVSAEQEIEFVGRVDSQIKLNGFRIELSEIETALRCHAQVASAYVRMCPVKRQIQAFYTSGDGSEVEDIMHSLAHMPHYMQPAVVLPVVSIPLNPNGKVDQKALDALTQPTQATVSDAPRSETMNTVLAIYEALLCAPVGCSDKSLFELGGNSLHLMQLLTQLRSTFSHRLELSFLAEHSSPKAICDWAELQQWNQTQDETTQEWTF